jgi:hypothetical protein
MVSTYSPQIIQYGNFPFLEDKFNFQFGHNLLGYHEKYCKIVVHRKSGPTYMY